MTLAPPVVLDELRFLFRDLVFSDLAVHSESQKYCACRFSLNNKAVEFRLAKITPKKVGQFVTIWKRNSAKITQPFDEDDELDYVLILCKHERKTGTFIFPKQVLIDKKIISKKGVGGKRGIRIYPTWDTTNNPQAIKTQLWQSEYFIALDENSNKFSEDLKARISC